MASPLTFFRRHQKGIMVAVICFSMFTFVVADAFSSSANPQATINNLPLMMGMLFGIIVGWIIGFKKTNVWAYISISALIGGVLFNTLGSKINLTEKPGATGVPSQQLSMLINDQQFSNNFFKQIVEVARGYSFGGNPKFFGFQQETDENDGVVATALQREANKLGMVVPDQFIADMIVKFTDDKVDKQQFAMLLKKNSVTENELYEILRSQFLAQNAYKILHPIDCPTPYAYWDAYRKLNQHAVLDVVQLGVSNFANDVKTPDEATLEKFFNEHKEVLAGTKGEGSPGFKLPPRAKIAYVEISYEAAEKSVPEITTQEIEEYYNKNKDKYQVNIFDSPVSPLEKSQPDSATPPATGTESPTGESEGTKQPAETTNPEMKLPATEKPVTETGTDPANTKPAENKPVEAVVPETKPDVAPTDKPAEKPTGEPADKSAGQPQSQLDSGKLIPELTEKKFWQVSLVQEEKSAVQEKPATENPTTAATDKPQDPAAKPDEASKPTETSKTTEKSVGDLSGALQLPPGESAGSMGSNNSIPEGFEKPATTAPPVQAPKIRPLDDELRKEIKDDILRGKTLEKLEALSKEIEGKLYDIGTFTSFETTDPAYKTAEQADVEFKQIAAEKKLYHNFTKLLSQKEFKEMEDDYAIVNSVTPMEFDQRQPFPMSTSTFEDNIFADDKPVLFSPIALENVETKNRYVCWITEFSPLHVPAYDEPGIKEFVLKTWKSIAARELVAKRGNEIIEMLKKSDKSTSEALGGQTETGKDNSPQLVVGTTGSFTWMSTSSVPAANFRAPQQVEVTSVPAISGGAGDEFMEVVFNQLALGEFGIAPNADKSVYFVVKLISRDPVESMHPKMLEENGWIKQNIRTVGAFFGEKQEKVREKYQQQILERNGLKILTKEDREKIDQQEMAEAQK